MHYRTKFRTVAFAATLALAGCGDGCFPDYEGEGDEFRLTGKVVDAGDESLKVEVKSIEYARGEAEDWFDIGNDHRIHDNCDCHGMWRGRKTYGTVYDEFGNVIEPHEVQEGECVDITGRIRADNEGKTSDERPVFERAELVDC